MAHNRFNKTYIDNAVTAISAIPLEDVDSVCKALLAAYKRGAQIFTAGNGGSAALAEHFSCDLSKTTWNANKKLTRRFRVSSLVSNTALSTAWANDEGYDHIFSEQLKSMGRPGDLLIVISSSGNSPNILRALETAKAMGIQTIALVGFGGGKAKNLAHLSIHIKYSDYGIVESTHSLLTHTITHWLANAISKKTKGKQLAEVA